MTAPEIDPVDPAEAPAEPEPATFSAEYVKGLREEAAAHRVRAKRTDDANARLAAAYAASDGRLVDASALDYSEDLLGDDGLVDRDRVAVAVSSLLESKPYLASRRPTMPIAQGVQADVPDPEPSLFGLLRQRV